MLFASGEHDLSVGGRDVLAKVGEALRDNIKSVYKIQIEGHTDDVPARRYREGNLELGALRAIAVYRFLQVDVGVDPAASLMSATSFGEFSPVDRVEGAPYSPERVTAAM